VKPKDVSAIIVTRGDVDLTPIINTLPYQDVIVYDNCKRHDFGIFGRYFAIREARNPSSTSKTTTCWSPVTTSCAPPTSPVF
jgi:hypothetical protein